jgi:hypothetical protein
MAILRAIDDAVAQGLIAYAGRTATGGYRPIYLSSAVPPLELEFSDDWVLLKPEVARRFLEPPRLERLEIAPSQVALLPGAHATFVARAFDQHGDDYPTREPHWSSSGGDLDSAGHFSAESPGFYTIAVEDSGRSAEAHAHVSTVVELASAAEGLSWSGEVPSQKWTQFYTRVLTKLVGKQGLEIRVQLRIPSDASVSEAARDEVAAALRDLGLDDTVNGD